MKTEESNWVSGSGHATGAPGAQAQFSSLHDIRFGKLGPHAFAPVTRPLQAHTQVRTPGSAALPRVAGFAQASAKAGGVAALTVVPRDPEGRRALRARDPFADLVRGGRVSALRTRMDSRGGALLGERPKRISWSDGARPTTLDTRAAVRTLRV